MKRYKAIDAGADPALAVCLIDRRQPAKVEHELIELVRQRVFEMACGYADGNDARLPQDPIHKLLLERIPSPAPALGSQPTLSRFQSAVGLREVVAMGQVLAAIVIAQLRAAFPAVRLRVRLDEGFRGNPGPKGSSTWWGWRAMRLGKGVRCLLGQTRMASKASGQSERMYGETRYAAKKWSHKGASS